VNQEPGPKTTQSAASTASTASGTAGGSAGTREIDRTCPGVTATETCPRTSVTASGVPGSAPSTLATISSGTAAIGSTRPVTRSSRPTQSSPATGSPRRSHRPVISRFPSE
jgi:hypothetical protein